MDGTRRGLLPSTAVQLALAAVAGAGAWVTLDDGAAFPWGWGVAGIPVGIVTLVGHRVERLARRRSLHGSPGYGRGGAVVAVLFAWFAGFAKDAPEVAALLGGTIVGSALLDLATVGRRDFLRHVEE